MGCNPSTSDKDKKEPNSNPNNHNTGKVLTEPDSNEVSGAVKDKNKDSKIDDSVQEEVISAEEREKREREIVEKRNQVVKRRNPRASVSAESYGKFNTLNFTPKKIEKTLEERNRIKSTMNKSFLFKVLDDKGFDIIIDALDGVEFSKGQVIITQGEEGSTLFLIESGLVECFRTSSDSGESFIRSMGPGDTFGELALMYSSKRSATIKAKTDCKMWVLDRETFNFIVKEQQIKKRLRHEKFLRGVGIFKKLSDYELGMLCDAFREEKKSAGELIIKEGDIGKDFYLVEEGVASITFNLKSNIQTEVGEGGYFGEVAILRDTKRTANVTAKTNCKLLVLDRDSFKRVLGPIEDILSDQVLKYTN